MRRLSLAALVLLALVGRSRDAGAQPASTSNCLNLLTPTNRPFPSGCTTCWDDSTTYTFKTQELSGSPIASAVNMIHIQTAPYPTDGALQMDAQGVKVLNPDQITLPYDENVKVLMVSKNGTTAGTHSGTLGWFYLDQLNNTMLLNSVTYNKQFYGTDGSGVTYLYDCDGDLIKDFFQGPTPSVGARKPGLWPMDDGLSTIQPAITISPGYTDDTAKWHPGNNYPHIPNLLEFPTPGVSPSNAGLGGIIFPLVEDDSDSPGLPNTTTTPALFPVYPNPLSGLFANAVSFLDSSSSVDGIPDNDVNGDGTVGNEADRLVDLGTLQGNREIVFYYTSYNGLNSATPGQWTVPTQALGICPNGGTGCTPTAATLPAIPKTTKTAIVPWFTKRALNIDSYFNYSTAAVGVQATPIANIDVGCTNYSTGCVYGGTTYSAWLDTNTLNRLGCASGMGCSNVTAYNNFIFGADTATNGRYTLCAGTPSSSLGVCPGTVLNQGSVVGCPGFGAAALSNWLVPHVLAGAPANDPDRWIMGFEDSPMFVSSSCSPAGTCTPATKKDYSDAVFLVQHQNGATITSNTANTETPGASALNFTLLNTWTIDKVRVTATASFPSPCPAPPAGATLGAGTNTRIELYYSLDIPTTNGVGVQSWYAVPFPASSDPLKADATVNLLRNGEVGNRLIWQARLISNIDGCQPKLTQLFVGYEAIHSLTQPYTYSEPVPIGNLVVRSSFWPSSTSWSGASAVTGADRSLRGFVKVDKLYEGGVDQAFTNAAPGAWTYASDNKTAAAFAAQRLDPDSTTSGRNIYFNNNGVAAAFTRANDAVLYPLVLPTALRTDRFNGTFVTDYNADGSVTVSDADWIIEWTRGYENWTTSAVRGVAAGAVRGSILGGIQRGTPTILTPPEFPWWLGKSRTPSTQSTTNYNAWKPPNRYTTSAVLVGSMDGMIHAFDLGAFDFNNGANGQFSGTPLYGSGKELWAFIPPSQLDKLRSNMPLAGGDLRYFSPGYPSSDPLLYPRASMDAPITLTDIWLDPATYPLHPGFRTVAVTPAGPHPYVNALDVTDSLNPTPLWASDWKDPDGDFQGAQWAAALSPVDTADAFPNDRVFAAAVTSGLTNTPANEYLYLINLATGQTLYKIHLSATKGYGTSGYPTMVDFDDDGVIDRVYLTLTDQNGLGHIIKVNLQTANAGTTYDTVTSPMVCDLTPIGTTQALGESVYAPLAVSVVPGSAVYLATGGADHPELIDSIAGAYHMFVLVDNDGKGACNTQPSSLASIALPAGRKLWTAPGFAGGTTPDTLLVTTSYGDVSNICGDDTSNPGAVMSWNIGMSGNNVTLSAKFSFNLSSNGTGVTLFGGGNQLISGSQQGTMTFAGTTAWPTQPTGTVPVISAPLVFEDRSGVRCGP